MPNKMFKICLYAYQFCAQTIDKKRKELFFLQSIVQLKTYLTHFITTKITVFVVILTSLKKFLYTLFTPPIIKTKYINILFLFNS